MRRAVGGFGSLRASRRGGAVGGAAMVTWYCRISADVSARRLTTGDQGLAVAFSLAAVA
jgi:hypothetical protein